MKVIEVNYFNKVIERLKIEENWRLFDEEVAKFNLKWEIFEGEYRKEEGFGLNLIVEYPTFKECNDVVIEVNKLIKKYFDNNFKQILKAKGTKL